MICSRARGAIAGVVNGVLLALVFAIDSEHAPVYSLLDPPWFVEPHHPTMFQLFLAVVMHAVPVGILWGTLIGQISYEVRDSMGCRLLVVPIVTAMLTLVSCLPWGQLFPYAAITSFACSVVLAFFEPPVTRTSDPSHP